MAGSSMKKKEVIAYTIKHSDITLADYVKVAAIAMQQDEHNESFASTVRKQYSEMKTSNNKGARNLKA
jgi:hypothetical protein